MLPLSSAATSAVALLLVLSGTTHAAVVGLTADLEMWPQDNTYLNVTATAGALVRSSGLPGLRYSVAADITLAYETTVWNGSLTARTAPRPYYQAIMEQVDEVLLMDYGQTTPGGLCGAQSSSPRCGLAKPLWWTAPWLTYAESLRRISDGRRQVLVTMGLPVDSSTVGTSRGWFASEEQLERFVNETTEWAHASGFTPANSCANATGWKRGPFHKTAVFMAEIYLNVTRTRPCPASACPAAAKRQPRGLWVYQQTADPMIYNSAFEAAANTAAFLSWCSSHGVDELYLYLQEIILNFAGG